MKKNLVVAVGMLCLAVLTLCGVTFAYFTGNSGGSNNSLQVGEFVFTSSAAFQSQNATCRFKAPTVLNVPQVTDGKVGDAEYLVKHKTYLTDGDDAYFNGYCLTVKVKVTNLSGTDMNVNVALSAAGDFVGENTAMVKYFVFNPADSALLLGNGNPAQAGKYAEKIREICSAAPLEAGETADGLTPLAETELRLKAGIRVTDAELAATRLTAATAIDEPSKNGQIELLTVVWLDYRYYKGAVAASSRAGGTVKLTVTVKTTNEF